MRILGRKFDMRPKKAPAQEPSGTAQNQSGTPARPLLERTYALVCGPAAGPAQPSGGETSRTTAQTSGDQRMYEAVLGAEPRDAVHVELDAIPNAELVGVEGAVLRVGVPLAEEVLEASR
jgi:hypothetical protein